MSVLYHFSFKGMETERFFDDLTLGLPNALNSVMGVENVMTVVSEGVASQDITDWQETTGYPLPPDLVSFYQLIDGLHITWGYKMRNSSLLKVGCLKIESLFELKPLGYVKNAGDDPKFETLSLLDTVSDKDHPKFNTNFKIIQLEQTRDSSIVCLVYSVAKNSHSIWLLDRSFQWHYITDSFTKYFYMMVKQAGLPEWQLGQTTLGLSMWAKQLTYTFALCLRSPPTDELRSWTVDGARARLSFAKALGDPTGIHFSRKKFTDYTGYFLDDQTPPVTLEQLPTEIPVTDDNAKILGNNDCGETHQEAVESNRTEAEDPESKSGSSDSTYTTSQPPVIEE